MKTTLFLIGINLIATTSFAQTTVIKPAAQQSVVTQKSAPQTRSSDKVDLKKLEDKYWSAKDEDYSVIQNRTFSKAGKFFASLGYGPIINDPFAKSKVISGDLGYYFNEDFGLSINYSLVNSEKSDSVAKFNTMTSAGISPDYNLPGNSFLLAATYTPFYAKMSFMNSAILYFDLGFYAGLGMSEYDQIIQYKDQLGNQFGESKIHQSSPQFEIGIMQQLFITKNFAFRLDLKNSFYNEKVVKYNVIYGTSPDEKSSLNNRTSIVFGLTLFTN